MSQMKDSSIEWLGEIPTDWEICRLKHCTTLDPEKLSENTDDDYEFQYVDISNVTEYGGIGKTETMTFANSPSRARMIVRQGDTIISTVRTYLKAIAYISGNENYICSTGFCVVRPNKKMDPRFSYYLLQSSYFVQKIVCESVGVSYPAISAAEIGNIPIALPCHLVQQRISCYLDSKCHKIDNLIAAKERTNALLKERRQSIIYEAVTKGLDPTVPMRDSGVEWIGEIPEGWDIRRVKHLATEADSLFLDGDWINSDVITDTGIRYLTSGNVGEGFFKEQGTGHISEKTFQKLHCLKALPGDLMICRLNLPLGRCCIIPAGEPFYVVAVDNVILRPNSGLDKRYLLYCMNTTGYASSAFMAASGTTMQRISRTELGNLFVPIAPLNEQVKIANHLDLQCNAIDSIIYENSTIIQKLKEYRQSLIYEAVTGKREVKNDHEDQYIQNSARCS